MDQQNKIIPSHLSEELSEFVSVDYPPQDDKPVLAIRLSGYTSAKYELVTARYQPDFRPLDPWRDLGGDSIRDSGGPILGWKNAMRWLQAR